jgi:CMP-N-acetylneuraminic acid synthetase
MTTLAVITARGGSKRVPRKNLRLLAGKPLVSWMIEAALSAQRLHRVIVSSEDPEILSIAKAHRAGLGLMRPAELALDTSPSIDCVRHAVSGLEAKGEGPWDVVVTLQPTTPLTTGEDIDATIALLLESGADTAVTVNRLEQIPHPAKLKVLGAGGRLLPYLEEERGRMAAHELPKVYVRNGAVYASKRSVIDGNRIIGDDCRGYVMPAERSVDVNYEMDWLFLEFLLARKAQGLAAK